MPKAAPSSLVQLKSCSDIELVDSRLRAAAAALMTTAPYVTNRQIAEATLRVISKTVRSLENNTSEAQSSVPVEVQLEQLREAAIEESQRCVETSYKDVLISLDSKLDRSASDKLSHDSKYANEAKELSKAITSASGRFRSLANRVAELKRSMSNDLVNLNARINLAPEVLCKDLTSVEKAMLEVDRTMVHGNAAKKRAVLRSLANDI